MKYFKHICDDYPVYYKVDDQDKVYEYSTRGKWLYYINYKERDLKKLINVDLGHLGYKRFEIDDLTLFYELL